MMKTPLEQEIDSTRLKAQEITDYFIHYLDSKIKKGSKRYNEFVDEIVFMLETD